MPGTDDPLDPEDVVDPAAALLAAAAALRAAVAEDQEAESADLDVEPPAAPVIPEPVVEEAPAWLVERRDPFARAEAALEAARVARGADVNPDPLPEVPPIDPRKPFAAAEAALARAREAQQATKGRHVIEREARARSELARLKGAPAGNTPANDDEETPSPPKPKQRRL